MHIASSPLAGAPSRLVDALNDLTPNSATLLRRGFVSDEQRAFEPNAVTFDEPSGTSWDLCIDLIRSADIVHIHNQLPIEAARLLAEVKERPATVFHVHSPPRERPNFFSHADFLSLKIDRSLVVPHFHPRCYWDSEMVPNIVYPPALEPIRDVPMRLLFSPSHAGGGRWNRKSSPATERALDVLSEGGIVELVRAEHVAPRELLNTRVAAAFSLDEVETGSYHQVSLEALASGSMAINRSDGLAMAAFRWAYRTSEDPPFLVASSSTLVDQVTRLATDPERLWEERVRSRDFFGRYMKPERVIRFYEEIYAAL